MDLDKNPFDEIYVSDSVDDHAFVELFSELPLRQISTKVFTSGNVVLKGIQGCGKTMILRLFLPETIIAFNDANLPLPIPKNAQQFLSAGVNITKSAIADISEISLGKGTGQDLEQLPTYFGDFFNWWILKDLFANLQCLNDRPDIFGWVNLHKEENFVQDLIKEDCWFDSLNGCQTINDLIERINDRVAIYRKWISYNIQERGVPEILAESKTAIGQPIIRTVECLKQSGIIPLKTPVFVRVDQLEDLHQYGAITDDFDKHRKDLRVAFRRMLNRAFGNREGAVHYRIGTRPYGWDHPKELLRVHGSGALLEHRRDYLLVDMDEDIFRRQEATGARFFSEFADDTFRRRLKHTFNLDQLPAKGKLKKVFGRKPTPKERADYYGRAKSKTETVSIDQALALEDPKEKGLWSNQWRKFLQTLYNESPLEAVLASAWARQTGGRGKPQHLNYPPPNDSPWKNKKWWRKERLILAVLQLASRRQQRLWWWGYEDVISLSGGNISVFLHVCYQVWDHLLKMERIKDETDQIDLGKRSIPKEIQAAAIQNASRAWFEKLPELAGGDIRMRFIEVLGRYFRVWLRGDKAMSYPGRNGISLATDELEEEKRPNADLCQFLRDATGYGALYQRQHTTKEPKGGRRVKYYLNPILSPFFQIPSAHNKEPKYIKIDDALALAKEARLPFTYDLDLGPIESMLSNSSQNDQSSNSNQMQLNI